MTFVHSPMVREFIRAEEFIAQSFRDGNIRFDMAALTIHDVGALKIVAGRHELQALGSALSETPDITVVEKEDFVGAYRATNLGLEVPWDPDLVCRKFREKRGWEKYLDRGIAEKDLKKGLEPLLTDAEPKIHAELNSALDPLG